MLTEIALVEQTDGILVEVNCSQTRYVDSNIWLKISAEQNGNIAKNVTFLCTNYEVLFDSLQCNIFFTIIIYWIPVQVVTSNECIIDRVFQKLQCPGITIDFPDEYV